MANLTSQVLLQIRCQIRIQPVRFRNVNVQKPFPPHFERAKVEHLCRPILPKDKFWDPKTPPHEICSFGKKYYQKEDIDNPYENLLAKDLKNWLDHSQLIAFFHKNSMRGFENLEMKILFKSNNMIYREIGKKLYEKATANSPLEVASKLFNSHTAIVYSETPQVANLFKVLKKTPKIILLAAVVEGRFLCRSELEYYAKLPDLETTRAGLVGVLNMAAQNMVQQLNQHQSTLVQCLQQHIDQSQTPTEKEPEKSSSTSESVSENTDK